MARTACWLNTHKTALWLAAITIVGALLRFWTSELPYLDLDSAEYIRAANQYRAALLDGSWLTNSLTSQHYSTIEYWPPLFPMLSALLGTTHICAALFGTLGILLIYAVAKQLWQDERLALIAAAIFSLHPFLVWYARVPRTEALYAALITCSLLMLFKPKAGAFSNVVGGMCLGWAYCTRFDALAFLPAAALAAFLLHRSWRQLGYMLAGFGLAALPYLAYLAWLNGGTPTLVSPDKLLYDTLEGIWTKSWHRSMYEFTTSFGVPGAFSIDKNAPEIQQLLKTQTSSLVWEGVQHIPASLASASWNWLLLLVPWGLTLACWRERKVQALWCLLLPIIPLAIATSWDPNPRYYAFTLVPIILLAVRGLDWLAKQAAPTKFSCWAIAAIAMPMQLGMAWIMPTVIHFDQRGPTDLAFLELLPEASRLKALVLITGILMAAAALWQLNNRWAAWIMLVQVGLTVLGAPLGALAATKLSPAGISDMLAAWFQTLMPLNLICLVLYLFAVYRFMPSQQWGPNCQRWLLAAMLVVACQNLVVLEAWGAGHSRLVYCPEVSAYLQKLPPSHQDQPQHYARPGFGGGTGPRLMAYQQVNALASGGRWIPLKNKCSLKFALQYDKPDFVMLSAPESGNGDPRLQTIPELEATGMVQLIGNYPAHGSLPGAPRWYRLYRVEVPR